MAWRNKGWDPGYSNGITKLYKLREYSRHLEALKRKSKGWNQHASDILL